MVSTGNCFPETDMEGRRSESPCCCCCCWRRWFKCYCSFLLVVVYEVRTWCWVPVKDVDVEENSRWFSCKTKVPREWTLYIFVCGDYFCVWNVDQCDVKTTTMVTVLDWEVAEFHCFSFWLGMRWFSPCLAVVCGLYTCDLQCMNTIFQKQLLDVSNKKKRKGWFHLVRDFDPLPQIKSIHKFWLFTNNLCGQEWLFVNSFPAIWNKMGPTVLLYNQQTKGSNWARTTWMDGWMSPWWSLCTLYSSTITSLCLLLPCNNFCGLECCFIICFEWQHQLVFVVGSLLVLYPQLLCRVFGHCPGSCTMKIFVRSVQILGWKKTFTVTSLVCLCLDIVECECVCVCALYCPIVHCTFSPMWNFVCLTSTATLSCQNRYSLYPILPGQCFAAVAFSTRNFGFLSQMTDVCMGFLCVIFALNVTTVFILTCFFCIVYNAEPAVSKQGLVDHVLVFEACSFSDRALMSDRWIGEPEVVWRDRSPGRLAW